LLFQFSRSSPALPLGQTGIAIKRTVFVWFMMSLPAVPGNEEFYNEPSNLYQQKSGADVDSGVRVLPLTGWKTLSDGRVFLRARLLIERLVR
jgi:hypothetical protein